MANFDIRTLLHFDPPGYACKNCNHLFYQGEVDEHFGRIPGAEEYPFRLEWLPCSVCGKQHTQPDQLRRIEFSDIFDHSRKLATVARAMYESLRQKNDALPIRVLFNAFLAAESFIHIVTYGMGFEFIGILKLISEAVKVRGIISNANERVLEEVENHQRENPNLELIALPSTRYYRSEDDPTLHQKLIIIDGLLAFMGSTNLTFPGWRSAGKGKDYIQVETDVGKIQELHDQYFCQHWYRLNPSSRDYSDEIPF